jgi:arginyl-tRNA synthetase
MTVYQTVQEKLHNAVRDLFPTIELNLNKIVIEPTKNSLHGDVATNAGLILSKQLKISPSDFFSKLQNHLQTDSYFKKIEIAGPGFINFTLNPQAWIDELQFVLDNNGAYDYLNFGKGKSVNVEFVSANPTGPLHTGHGRNAVLGDTIALLLQKAGYDVVREYYINDAGGQIKTLTESVYLRYREACGETVLPEEYSGKYPGDYLIPVGQALFQKYGKQYLNKPGSDWENLFKDFSITEMLSSIKTDLKDIGIEFDVYTSEKSLIDKGLINKTLETLKDNIYVGTLPHPKGHTIEDWEDRPQTLFRSTAYGDDVDRALKKADGSSTYFAGDVAYHLDKINRKFDKMINLFGADHIGYIKRLKAAVSALSNGKADFEIKATQMVNFLENGEPVKMSKRAGTFICLKDVVDRVGKDATRFMMVSRHQDMPIDFDFEKTVEASKDNPLFYIQYAHARIHSVFRKAKELCINFESSEIDLSVLNDEKEIDVLKLMAAWPREIELAIKTLEPHRICNFLYNFSSEFHSLWNCGKENVQMRFIDINNISLTQARLKLLQAIAIILYSGLELLGIKALKEM